MSLYWEKEADIREFVEKVVISGLDTYEEKRNSFYDEFLISPNGIRVADNIIQSIKLALAKE